MKLKLILASLALLASPLLSADTRGVNCDGCSSWQMSQAARQATTNGIVYVFNGHSGRVDKYRVFSEMLDLYPPTSWTSAARLTTESQLKRAYADYLDAVAGLGFDGVVVLPGDFPVRSVAGALMDPDFASTAIENYLMTLTEQQQLELTLAALASKVLDLNLPIVDLRSIIKAVTLRVEFPDGSSQDYTVDYSMNQGELRSRTELTPHGNAMAADGLPAPTSALGFRNRRFHDNGGSLIEWIALAWSFGVRIGGSSGTTMECVVDGHTIYCVVSAPK